jgi:prepilin-type N-terminal cleavage/methylation domain-containing protein
MIKNRTVRSHGFTLIEVVVVAVIVAILAAVAIPMLSGFVNDSRQRAVDELAQSAAAAADGFVRKTNPNTIPDVADLNLFFDQSKFTISVDATNVTVQMIGHADRTKTVRYH